MISCDLRQHPTRGGSSVRPVVCVVRGSPQQPLRDLVGGLQDAGCLWHHGDKCLQASAMTNPISAHSKSYLLFVLPSDQGDDTTITCDNLPYFALILMLMCLSSGSTTAGSVTVSRRSSPRLQTPLTPLTNGPSSTSSWASTPRYPGRWTGPWNTDSGPQGPSQHW